MTVKSDTKSWKMQVNATICMGIFSILLIIVLIALWVVAIWNGLDDRWGPTSIIIALVSAAFGIAGAIWRSDLGITRYDRVDD